MFQAYRVGNNPTAPQETAMSSNTEALKKDITQLHRELNIERKPVSECVKDLIDFTNARKDEDKLVVGIPADMVNPFQEKKRCDIL